MSSDQNPSEPVALERWPGFNEQSWSERFAELDRRFSLQAERMLNLVPTIVGTRPLVESTLVEALTTIQNEGGQMESRIARQALAEHRSAHRPTAPASTQHDHNARLAARMGGRFVYNSTAPASSELVERLFYPSRKALRIELENDMRKAGLLIYDLQAALRAQGEVEAERERLDVEAVIAALKAEQERLDDEDYIMDTADCIDVIREKFAALKGTPHV